jgi:outer membrane lipase/esterase
MRVNAFALINEVFANPSLYGFTNTTIPCVRRYAVRLSARRRTSSRRSRRRRTVFADGVHPTTGAHALIAQAVLS